MLCQFSVTNYKCFQYETTLDLQAADISEHEDSLITSEDGESFLPLSVIYGPNGSGKSTILHALYSLVCKIMKPICTVTCEQKDCDRLSFNHEIVPFKFSSDSKKESTIFELFFRTLKYEYQYKLSILKNKVKKEELYRKAIKNTNTQYTTLYKREDNSIGEALERIKKFNYDGLSDEILFLSFLGITHRKDAIVKDIINWFENKFQYINYSNPVRDSQIMISENKEIKDLMINMLYEMDMDIVDYEVKKEDEKTDIYTYHQVGGRKYQLDLMDESNGTIKIFGLLPYIARSLSLGDTIIIDELDAKIHPLLLKYIISLYRNKDINKKNAQLIFTSHDLTTMNKEMFRRDEIWFVAKGEKQYSNMYSLVEFKKADDQSGHDDEFYDKKYIEGRYGADPYLKRIINWEVL